MDAPLQQYNIPVPNYTLPKNIIISETDEIRELRRFIIGEKFIRWLKERDIIDISQSNYSVLLQGETGTGKLLVARAIHNMSRRKNGPFQHINCGAFMDTLLENEILGHEKGAFYGATGRKLGLFELAGSGSFFMDDVHNMSLSFQEKTLNAIENKWFRRLGGNEIISADVRIISATNKDLKEEINHGRFNKEFYNRINRIKIILPPLKERKEDIPLLVEYFITIHKKDSGKEIKSRTDESLKVLMDYDWPGNIRELENTIISAMVHCKSGIITPECFKGTDMFDSQLSIIPKLNNNIPVSQKVKEFLLDMKSGERITNKEIRKYFKVSHMTFCRIMRQLCNQGIFKPYISSNIKSSFYIRA